MSTIYYSVMILFLQFSIYLNFLPKSRYIAIFMILVACFYKYVSGSRYSKYSLTIAKPDVTRFWGHDESVFAIELVVILLYTIFIAYFRGSLSGPYTTDVSTVFNYTVMMLIISPLIYAIIPDKRKFCDYYINATLIQSGIVILSFLLPSVREWLMSSQNADIWENFGRYRWRIIGLGIVGSGGSVYLFAGYICCLYKTLFLARSRDLINIIKTLIILVGIGLIGRTGFYAALVLTFISLIMLLKDLKKLSKVFQGIFISIIAVLCASFFLGTKVDINSRLFEYTLNRIGEIFQENNTLDTLSNYYRSDRTPEISIYTLFGSGIIRGTMSNGQVISNDSGYAKRYASIGLIMAILSYAFFLSYLYKKTKLLDIAKRRYIQYIVIIMLVIEYKEPFIYMYALPFSVLMLSNYENIDKRTNMNQNLDKSQIDTIEKDVV